MKGGPTGGEGRRVGEERRESREGEGERRGEERKGGGGGGGGVLFYLVLWAEPWALKNF